MELRLLQTFLQVAATQNFTRAARALGYSQSNVSAQIAALEQKVGAPLFDRIGRRVFLTSYGERLLPHAQDAVSAALRAENLLKPEGELSGTLRAGMVDSLYELIFEQAVTAFHRRFPRVRVELTVDGSSALKEQLAQGLIDLACLIDDPLPPGAWRLWQRRETKIAVAAAPSHPLVQRKRLELADLKDEEFILMEDTASYSAHFLSAASRTFAPRAFLKLQSAAMALRLTQKSSCLTVLPRYALSADVRAGRVAALNVTDLDITQEAQLVLHPGKAVTPQIEGFLTELGKSLDAVLEEE